MNTSNDFGSAAGRKTVQLMQAAYARLQDHYRWSDTEFSGEHNEMGVEAYNRLSQTIRLVEKVVVFLEQVAAGPQIPSFATGEEFHAWVQEHGYEVAQAQHKNVDDMQIFTDCAYLLAWRASGAIDKLPGLNGFKPVGVRDVRNKLIEHVDGKDIGILMNSFGWGGPQGPVVRAIRTEDKKDLFPDAGLFVNMTAYSDDLVGRIDRVLAGKVVPPPSK